jgi:hypothetical protein
VNLPNWKEPPPLAIAAAALEPMAAIDEAGSIDFNELSTEI